MTLPAYYVTVGDKAINFFSPKDIRQFLDVVSRDGPMVVILHTFPKALLYDTLKMAAVSDNVEYCVVDLYDRSLRNFLNVEYRERPYLMYYEKGVQMHVPQHIVVLFANAVDAIFS